MSIVLTFESWVRYWPWYRYACAHPGDIPQLLIDRSPCTDPFFDHYSDAQEARPLISGLCRPRKHYPTDERFIYITRVHRRVLRDLGRTEPTPRGPVYLSVASLRVVRIHESHALAAATFSPAHYASIPAPSNYPPNLAHSRYPGAAVDRGARITHDMTAHPHVPHTPATSTHAMHVREYNAYYLRQQGLPVAECRFEEVDGGPARAFDPHNAPVLTAADWGGTPMNQRGVRVPEPTADGLVRQLVTVGRIPS